MREEVYQHMKFVEPIRDLNKISSMKKILFAQSERNYLLFTIGINSPYRISDLIRVQFKHVLDSKNSVRSHLMLNKKQGRKIRWLFLKGSKKRLRRMLTSIMRGIQKPIYLGVPSGKCGFTTVSTFLRGSFPF